MCKAIKSLPMMSTMVQNDFDNSDSNKNNEMMIIVLTLEAFSVQHDLENADLDYSPMRMLSRVHIIYIF